MMLLVVAAVALGAVWLSRRTIVNGHTGNDADALDVLRRRYALGELSGEQFEEMQETLRK